MDFADYERFSCLQRILKIPQDTENVYSMVFRPCFFLYCTENSYPSLKTPRKLFDLLYFPHSKTSHAKKTWAQLMPTNSIIMLIKVSKAILRTCTSKIVNTELLNHIKYNFFFFLQRIIRELESSKQVHKKYCIINTVSRETKLGPICNQTGFFSRNCTVKLLDGTYKQETNIQYFKYSASGAVSHSQYSSLWVKSPVSVWEGVIEVWFWVCFWAKSFEALFVLKHGITMNSVTDHFPNDHASCSETCHLPLCCTTTATTSHHNIFTPSENAIMCAQIDKQIGLKRCIALT